MQSNLIKAFGMTYQSSVTKTSTFTGATTELPLSEAYAFYLNVTAVTGTTPTMDVAIQVTPDNGTTWFTAARFAQVTAASKRRLQIQPCLGKGETGSEAAVADTGGALSSNTIITKKTRHVATIGGTNPSFTYAIYLLAVSRSAGD